MAGQCFYRTPPSAERKRFLKETCDIKLDSALNELGMLSTITNSRVEYLKEKEVKDCVKEMMKRKNSSNSQSSSPLCVVHMNSDFVTQFSLSKNSTPVTECKVPDESLETPVFVTRKRLTRAKRNFYAPYYLNRRIVPPEKLEDECYECTAVIKPEDQASPPIITRQDSGNKSNPSSPVKSQNSLTSVGCSIFRSRSLDDLEISKLNNLNESCDLTSHGDIDTVSQCISKLQVS